MGYASHVAVKSLDNAVTTTTRDKLTLGLALYYAQLGLNFAWTPLFFGAHKVRHHYITSYSSPGLTTAQTGLALVDSAALTLTTWYMTKLFDRPTNGKATWFLLPYCGWLAYATYLNAGIWWLNGGEKKAKSF
jgi:benzodiazapine receptor